VQAFFNGFGLNLNTLKCSSGIMLQTRFKFSLHWSVIIYKKEVY